MNLTGKKAAAIAVIVIILLSVLVVYAMKWVESDKVTKPEREEHPVDLSAWIVDWQWKSGLDDLRGISDGLTSVQAFAAYFDDTDSLYFTKKHREALPRITEASRQGSLVHVDLTVVNDRIVSDGTTVQKDPTIITRLMATEESRSKHIDNILDVVAEYDFHGVEIDYERIDDSDWSNVTAFYAELYQRLDAIGKSLRIVLEPRTPIERLSLPEGPVYVMMAYNLYGGHSGPGPKADHAFIAKLAGRLDQVPGDNIIALATGGFDWSEAGKVAAVTEQRAVELSQLSLKEPQRDVASGSIYFDYRDDNDVMHTVWYADHVTLSQWIDVAQQAGYDNIALWRLGDLGQETLKELNRRGLD
ncbi:glycosyl hydrolase family 18 protein [Paenibacillus sp. N3/727]|nr:glycosyl hydrolase family 18 protein [Paenibacillus sp. N3/727]UNK21432.1 glycosyl hydrolase family 18 protein [Paenibacillus sp. N3/727]